MAKKESFPPDPLVSIRAQRQEATANNIQLLISFWQFQERTLIKAFDTAKAEGADEARLHILALRRRLIEQFLSHLLTL